ncbi:hypothetical protein C1H46_020468 [Malus baccata]|uniref:Cullin N-terminal domain-containing protein n=1 Tax=Malus baccata TaxID=106549 RepID=A0A540M5X4_MALBA|nr:hypothetical protein C1H46_020468 [Malus baccata]
MEGIQVNEIKLKEDEDDLGGLATCEKFTISLINSLPFNWLIPTPNRHHWFWLATSDPSLYPSHLLPHCIAPIAKLCLPTSSLSSSSAQYFLIQCNHDCAPDIQSPFHVRDQHSQHCGHHGYELHCNNNTTLIHFPSYGDMVVKSILLSPSFAEVPCLSGLGYHVYTVEPSLSVPDSCRVVKTIPITFGCRPYLSDSSFDLGLTWGFLGQQDCEANEGQSLPQLETDQQTQAKIGYKKISSTTMEPQVIEWEQGWSYMQKGISKLKRIIQGLREPQFSSKDYMMLYTTVYNMCTQKPPCDYSRKLYDKYQETFENYINSTVLPSLKEKLDEFMLQELVKSWENHKVMVRWLSCFFHYLDRYFVADRSLRPPNEVGLNGLRDLVYREIKVNTRVVVIGLINKEREGEQIDRTLLKNVINIFVEIGMGEMDAYEEDFEAHMLTDTGK